tara:strand:+ start:384 stop:1430 length:1047 start_codon:yes stop_codon:yes gene_type:complete
MIRVAIIGTGSMAHYHALEYQKLENVKIVAACDINKENLYGFQKKYKIPNIYTSIDELLTDCEVDAISNVTPDNYHKEIAIKSLERGKHIFSEKPLAENYQDALEMYEVAKSKKLINMVNLSYRNSSGFQELVNVVHTGELGSIKHVEASYYQSWLTSKYWGDWKELPQWLWRLSKAHGSNGVLGDLGVHIIDFVTYPVGRIKRVNSLLKTFIDKGKRVGEYILDANDSFISMVEFENGATGTIVSTRFATGYRNRLDLKIFCNKGGVCITLEHGLDSNSYKITRDINTENMYWDTVYVESTPNNIERFIHSIISGENGQPDFKVGADVQKIIDSCIESSEKQVWIDI